MIQTADPQAPHGFFGTQQQGQATLNSDFAIDRFDMRMQRVGRKTQLVGQLLLAGIRIQAAQHHPFALRQALEGGSQFLRAETQAIRQVRSVAS